MDTPQPKKKSKLNHQKERSRSSKKQTGMRRVSHINLPGNLPATRTRPLPSTRPLPHAFHSTPQALSPELLAWPPKTNSLLMANAKPKYCLGEGGVLSTWLRRSPAGHGTGWSNQLKRRAKESMTANSMGRDSKQHDSSDHETVQGQGPQEPDVGGALRLTMTRALSLKRGATRSLEPS